MIAFLQLILPIDGWLVAVAKTPKGMLHHWCDAFEVQAAKLLEWSEAGYDTYHGCASYKEPGTKYDGRKQANVHLASSLWADIDTREGKSDAPYADRKEAVEALGRFCRETPLPRPLVVNSGSGLHAYWPLDEDLPLDEWKPYAQGLKAHAMKRGFHIDPHRTSDAASILRTPGTKNYKS